MITFLLAATLLSVSPSGSSAVIDPLGRGAWFTDTTNDEVVLAHPATGVQRFACRWPAAVVVSAQGDAYAACRADGAVRKLTQPAEVWPVGPEPSALAIDAATGALYVALATSNAVVVLSPANGTERRRFLTAFEPTAIALFNGTLVVGSRRSSRVQTFPLATDDAPSDVALAKPQENVALGVEHFVTKRDGLFAVAASATLGSLDQPTYYFGSGGSPVAQQLYLLEPGAKWRRVAQITTSDVASATWNDKAKTLLLAGRGDGRVTTWDPKATRHLSTQRLKEGLVGAVEDGTLLYAMNDQARVISVLAQAKSADRSLVTQLALPASKHDAELDRGRALFFTASDRHVSASGLACASCHVDGRDDGRTWLGQGAMRQTPMLAGRDIAHTAPYGWNGKYETLEKYIAFTISSRLRGGGLSEPDLKALARYVREGLPAVHRPRDLNEAVARGSVVFHSDATGCASCHPSDGAFSDGATHDVASVGPAEVNAMAVRLMTDGPTAIFRLSTRGVPTRATPAWRKKVDRALDTPSLLQAGLSAPYLHDGSAPTVDAVFAKLKDHMGAVSSLSARERADLVAYVEAL